MNDSFNTLNNTGGCGDFTESNTLYGTNKSKKTLKKFGQQNCLNEAPPSNGRSLNSKKTNGIDNL